MTLYWNTPAVLVFGCRPFVQLHLTSLGKCVVLSFRTTKPDDTGLLTFSIVSPTVFVTSLPLIRYSSFCWTVGTTGLSGTFV